MDAATSAVLSIAIDRQGQQLQFNANLVREAKRSDAAVLQLLDAAKSLEAVETNADRAHGHLLHFTA